MYINSGEKSSAEMDDSKLESVHNGDRMGPRKSGTVSFKDIHTVMDHKEDDNHDEQHYDHKEDDNHDDLKKFFDEQHYDLGIPIFIYSDKQISSQSKKKIS